MTEDESVVRLSAGSVRRRITVAVIAVLSVVLFLLSVGINSVYAAQSERSLDALLSGRSQLARQLARSGVGPEQIIKRVTVSGVQAQLTLRNGRQFASAAAPDVTAANIRTERTTLRGPGRINGALMVVAVDASLVRGAQLRLTRLLVIAGLAALIISTGLVLIIVRLALRPLAVVAGLARSISSGNRGLRLRPSRPDTELGETAHALDAMLDELEGAEARARTAEQQSQQFLADAAHELRTPIAGVQAAAETLLHQTEQLSTQERQRLQSLMIGEARRAGRLVSDLLESVRLESTPEMHLTPTDLHLLAAAEVDRLNLRAPDATVCLTGPSVTVTCDAERIGSVLRNLLENALRATQEQGLITIRLAADPTTATIDVADSGPGVRIEDRERIFQRMVRLDADRSAATGGSGLGLSIARGWARAHRGDLRCVEPPTGQGALFRLILPRTAGSAQRDR